jgi:DNA end-binding protein Ku
VRKPVGLAPDEVKVSAGEIKMAQSLMATLSEGFELAEQFDDYRDALDAAIEAKAAGGESVPEVEAPRASNVLDLTALLKKSLENAPSRAEPTKKSAAAPKAKAAPAKTAARKTAARKTTARKTTTRTTTARGTAAKKTTAKKSAARKAG